MAESTNKDFYNFKSRIQRIIYYNTDSKWGCFSVDNVLENDDRFPDKFITISGNFENLYQDAQLEISGNFKIHPRYGNQIEIQNYKILYDVYSKESIINFLSKSYIKGISLQNSRKIYNVHGSKSIEIVLHDSDKLLEISGIGDKTVEKIKKSVEQYKDMEPLIEYATQLGFTYNLITKIYKELGKNALDILKENIYSILDFSENLTFKQIDGIALRSGIKTNDINRVKYCFLHVLKMVVIYNGSTGCDYKVLKKEVVKELGVDDTNIFNYVINILTEENKIILENNKVFYKKFYEIEKNIAQMVLKIVNRDGNYDTDINVYSNKSVLDNIEEEDFNLDEIPF